MDIDYQTFEAGDFTCLPAMSNGCAASIGFIADHIPRKDSVVIMATGKDAEGQPEVAGHILATANEMGIYVHTVNVMENYRRQGIATRMLAEVERLIDLGTAQYPISLFTDNENVAAVRCYKSAGFTVALMIPNCRESGEIRLAMQKARP
jgi:ribosomal protein S18 acetylase RimI-like enzyme